MLEEKNLIAMEKFLVFFLLASVAGVLSYEAPDDCDWTFIDDESGFQGGVSLTCHLSAINSNVEKTNFSVIPSDGTKRLVVKCDDASLSHLDKAAFASLYQLEELVLDGCRLEHLPPLAFEGLTLLQKLTIQTRHAATLSIAIDAFVGLPSLTHLDLSNNYVRSIQRVEPGGGLKFYCAIDRGVVLRVARGEDLLENLEAAFSRVRAQIGPPQLVLTCDCILRKLEIDQMGLQEAVGEVLLRNNALGFNTYGEQFCGVHVNQTLTAVALGFGGAHRAAEAGDD